MKKNHAQHGQSLVEMIVVIGVVMLLVTGILSGTTNALSRTKTSELRSAAIQYAQQGIEVARLKRDNGWDAFAALGNVKSTYCVGSDGQFNVSSGACAALNIAGTFTRSITLSLIGGSVPKMSVEVAVAWGDITNPSNKVTLVTYLTQWR